MLRTRQTHLTTQVPSSRQIANYFNRQFTTSMLARHTSSRNTQLVPREIKWKSLTSAVIFTTDQVTIGVSSCSNIRAYRPYKLIILHPPPLGLRAIECFTALSTTPSHLVGFRRFGSHPMSSQSRNQEGTPLSTSYRPISLLYPTAKIMEALLLPTVNSHLLPSADQHGFRPEHSTTSALLQLRSDIATGFKQRKFPHRTVCVVVDLTAAFDTVNHNVLLSKIVRSILPEATCQWVSKYVRGRQSITS